MKSDPEAAAATDRRGWLEVVAGLPPRSAPIPFGETSIGSSPASGLVLEHPTVSPQHCRIEAGNTACWIEDAGSAAGTFVNGVRISTRTRLRTGDVIHLGAVCTRWIVEGTEVPPGLIFRGQPAQELDLEGRTLTLGIDPGCDVILAAPGIDRQHARIEGGAAGACVIAETRNGECLANGRHFDRHQLVIGDQIDLGPFHFRYDGRTLHLVASRSGASLVASDLTVVVQGRRMLDRVSLRIGGGEFVGIIGATGAGKSTLLRALNGQRPADSGRVWLQGRDLYADVERARREFGWVPQENIVHRELGLAEALLFAARLRLPADTPPREIARLVTEVAGRLGLQDRLQSTISTLSGGESKKASVAVELLSRPRILFLDEPTSGLDPGAEGRMMALLRQLADGGCTVVCTTHVMQNLYLLDRLVVVSDGTVVFSGRPEEVRDFFGVREMAGIFERLDERRAAEWREAFRALHPEPEEPPAGTAEAPGPSRRRRLAAQTPVLLARQWATWTADWRNFAILLGQPVLIGMLLAAAVQGTADDSALKLFFVSVATLWFGCSNGAQQIVGELPIYRRERMAGLRRRSYVFAKWLFLGAATLFQGALLYVVTRYLGEGTSGDPAWQLGGLAVMAVVATGFGLAISALSRSATQAVLLVPFLIIPQIVLSGFTVPVSSMIPPVLAVSEFVPSFQLQRTMDMSLVWGERIDATTLQAHLQVVQNLNVNGAIRTGDVYADAAPGWLALAIQAAWFVIAWIVALVSLRAKEREY